MQNLPLCKLHLVAASRSYTCAQDGLDTVQLALVVFSFHQLAQIRHFTHGGHHLLQLALVVFSLEHYVAHLLMCTLMNRHMLQIALWAAVAVVYHIRDAKNRRYMASSHLG